MVKWAAILVLVAGSLAWFIIVCKLWAGHFDRRSNGKKKTKTA